METPLIKKSCIHLFPYIKGKKSRHLFVLSGDLSTHFSVDTSNNTQVFLHYAVNNY